MKHIAIAGNIGAGKTVLAAKLAKHYNWIAQFDAVDDNPYLVDFYKDMKLWAFHLQIYFLHSRFNQTKKARESSNSTVQDRTIYEDAYVFASALHRADLISSRDFNTYMGLFESLVSYVSPPDLLIYLKADIPQLVDQIQKRGRSYEDALRLDYLKSLNAHYDAWIQNYKLGKLLIIDVNKIDFINRVEDFAEVISRIDIELNGLFSQKKL